VIAYLFLGLLILVCVMLLMRWAVNADPALLARILKIVGIALGVAGALLLIWRGPLGLVLFLAAGAILYMLRRAGQRQTRMAAGPSGAGTSALQTAMLSMTLEHESGRLDGTVREGRYGGQRLSALSLAEILELLDESRRSDPESTPVLEAFLDRSFGADWREREAGGENPRSGGGPREAMTHEEALEVLGLAVGASAEEIREAHRRLMQKVHPDHGGSSYLAARINQARDVLLGE
jgi:hypothetical protein